MVKGQVCEIRKELNAREYTDLIKAVHGKGYRLQDPERNLSWLAGVLVRDDGVSAGILGVRAVHGPTCDQLSLHTLGA